MANDEFGDFQTPLELASQCLARLNVDVLPARVLEPTCGAGAFLEAAKKAFPGAELLGIEVQLDHVLVAREFGRVLHQNVFTMDLSSDVSWETEGPLVVIGNPPWVTAAELARLGSDNVPPKENFKQAKGLDAITGSANFDVSEYILLKALSDLEGQAFTLGMLCKTQVARNVLEYAASIGLPIRRSATYAVDAKKHFGALVDACWFTVTVSPAEPPRYVTDVFNSLDAETPASRFGYVGEKFVSDVDKYVATSAADGACPYVWRQGLKHDATQVMELVATPSPETKAGIPVDVEPEFVFPLLKSTDIFRDRCLKLSKWVIVPQRTLGQETKSLRVTAPKLWDYLTANGDALDARKSSIYRNRPRFSVFGLGPYTFVPYKVAISGMHKDPRFRLVAPIEGRPCVFDDTCYFLPFDDAAEAALAWALLSSQESIDLIESLVFWDSKRPITKKLLSRLSLFDLPVDKDAIIGEAVREATRSGLSVSKADVIRVAALWGDEKNSGDSSTPDDALF